MKLDYQYGGRLHLLKFGKAIRSKNIFGVDSSGPVAPTHAGGTGTSGSWSASRGGQVHCVTVMPLDVDVEI